MLFPKLLKVWRAPISTLTTTLFFTVLLLPSESHARASSGSGTVFVTWNPNPEADIAGYKVHYGTASGVYDVTIDVGMATEVEIPAPSPDQPYFTAVTAYNAANIESGYSAEILVIDPAWMIPKHEGRLIAFEAESGTVDSPMATASSGGDTWIETPDGMTTGSVTIPFEAPLSGSYYMWARVKAPALDSDSLFYSLDGGSDLVFYAYGSATPDPGAVTSEWVWQPVCIPDGPTKEFLLAQGPHEIRFATRSGGILLDRIAISSRPDFVPDDSLPSSGDMVSILDPQGDRSVMVGDTITLSCDVISTGPVNYQWTKDGVPVTDGTWSSLTIFAAGPEDAGSYQLHAWTGTAFVSSTAALLTVADEPLAISHFNIQPDLTVTFDVSGPLNLEIQAFASSDMITWEPLGNTLNTSGQISLSDPGAEGQPRRFYRLETP